MKSSWLLLGLPALLATTSLVSADDAFTYFSLSGTAGGVVMSLPDGGGQFEGVGIDDPRDVLLGATIGFSAAAGLGQIGEYDGFVGLTGFLTYAVGDYDETHTFTGPGVVVIQGGAGPNLGAISIATSSAPGSASASVSITNTGPEANAVADGDSGTSLDPPGGAQDAAFVSASGESFAWGGISTEADGGVARSAAYAAIADTNGGVFIAAGDLTGLSVTTDYKSEVYYAGADLTFGLSGQGDGAVTLQGYAGPSYRYLNQRNSTDVAIAIDVPEFEAITDFPMLGISSTENLTSHYLGGVVGAAATMPIDEKSFLTVGAELAGYYASATLNSSGTYTVEGGGPVPYVLQTVNSEGAAEDESVLAAAVRGTAVYTIALDEKTQISFAASVDYLSRVAQAGVNAVVTGYDGTDDGTVEYTSGGGAPRITWGDMWAFSGSVSLTGQF